MPPFVTVATWNVEWAVLGSHRGRRVEDLLAGLDADVLCVTEAQLGVLPSGGATIQSEANYGYPNRGGTRRKVVLWSRSGWDDVDVVGDPSLPPGRFAMGTTSTALGPVKVIGVCISWRDAHVRTGRRDCAAWEEHTAFLDGLGRVIAKAGDDGLPSIVVGDFNQCVPRVRQPRAVADQLCTSLQGLRVLTGGIVPGVDAQLIDHVAESGDLRADEVLAWPRRGADGARLSDHDGVMVTLSRQRGSKGRSRPTPGSTVGFGGS